MAAEARQNDPFVNVLGSVRDLVLHVIAIADWKLTLACLFGFAGRLTWPLMPDDMATHGFLGLFSVSFGACLGKQVDRKLVARLPDTATPSRFH